MQITEMLEQLRLERERIEQAILVLQQLGAGTGKRRGRPPKALAELRKPAKTPKPTK